MPHALQDDACDDPGRKQDVSGVEIKLINTVFCVKIDSPPFQKGPQSLETSALAPMLACQEGEKKTSTSRCGSRSE